MDTLRDMGRLRGWVRIGVPDPWLTPVSGMVAVTELVHQLGMVKLVGAVIGVVKTSDRGGEWWAAVGWVGQCAAGWGGFPGWVGPLAR
ncbi:MAG: hypothetical protein ACRDQ4_26185 [Pseudonocardiaceae bacterium]